VNVEQLLRNLNFEQYLELFRTNEITGDVLPHLQMEDLKEIGVVPVGHRRLILAAIQETSGPKQNETANAAERRYLTILFADLVGSTQLSQRLAAEDLRDLIRAYQDSSKTAIERFGGYVAQYLGDGIVVYFGYPRSHEDDVERSIRAGFELIAAVADIDASFGRHYGVDIQVRIGIETGPVIVGDIVGEGVSRERAVVGETPNFAARLQGLARPGEIVIGPGAKRLLGGNAQLQTLGSQTLKGYDDPVDVWSVQGLGFAGGRFERLQARKLSQFVGRDTELEILEDDFKAVKAGESRVAEFVGEAGIGKSRLVHEFLSARSSSTRILVAHCASHGGSTAFFPFIDMFRRALEADDAREIRQTQRDMTERLARAGLHRDTEIPYVLNLLGLDEGIKLDQDLIGIRTQAAIVSFVGHQSRILPTILFVNDLHWIDNRSISVLQELAASSTISRLLLLGTYRDSYTADWPTRAEISRIELNALAEVDAAVLFKDRFGGESTQFGQDILLRTGGNPLFLEELAGHLKRSRSDPSDAEGVPDTLAGLLLEQVDAQTADARQLVRKASVAGRRFSTDVVAGSEIANDRSAFSDLLESGLIIEDGAANRYRFKHALVQDAIYDGLLAEDRALLHGEVGARIETVYRSRLTEFAEELSRHFEIAGDLLKAARYAYTAGGKAFDLFALGDADYWFLRAIELFPSDAENVDEKRRAQAISNHIQISCWDARFTDMISLADQEISRIEAMGDTRELSRTLSWLGEGHLNCANFKTAEDLLSRSLAIGERLKDLDSIGYALGEYGWLRTITQRDNPLIELKAHARRLNNIAENLGDNYLATLAHYVEWAALVHGGYVAAATAIANRLIALGHESGYPPALNWGYCMLSYCEVLECDLQAAHDHAIEARRAAQCAFDDLMADLSMGIVLARSSDVQGCRQYLGRAQRLGDQTGSLFFAYVSEAEFGRALALNGYSDEAAEWLRASREFFEKTQNPRATVFTGLALSGALASRDPDDARQTLQSTLELSRAYDMPGWSAQALLLMSQIEEVAANRSKLIEEAGSLAKHLDWQDLTARIREIEA
jgi:class 3 adenylate cyclase